MEIDHRHTHKFCTKEFYMLTVTSMATVRIFEVMINLTSCVNQY